MVAVVQLTHFSTRHPVFGGQRRSAALRAALSASGHMVSLVETFGWSERLAPDDYCYDATQIAWLSRYPDEAEIRFPAVIENRSEFALAIADRIEVLKPDVLWIEQPYLWPYQKKHLARWGDPRVVYSSHNVEWLVRQDIQADRSRMRQHVVSRVKRTELDFVRAADLVVAVTHEEAALFERAGAQSVLVCGNGAHPPPSSASPTSGRAPGGRSGSTAISRFS
ncbi:glycosyltransferase [Lichenihabitans psoromatis]|uniref:glycosyltransferase n=1 Tax=Lichenihabitans psoromatis TaxID=2528642 RepID=UPI0013F16E0C|nr:glycosyltransferase [Lichenihabitans psoromatis]